MQDEPEIRLRLFVSAGACAVLVARSHLGTSLVAGFPQIAEVVASAGLRFAGISFVPLVRSRMEPGMVRLDPSESLTDAVRRLLEAHVRVAVAT